MKARREKTAPPGLAWQSPRSWQRRAECCSCLSGLLVLSTLLPCPVSVVVGQDREPRAGWNQDGETWAPRRHLGGTQAIVQLGRRLHGRRLDFIPCPT
jgi:hypothetical protein